MTLSKSLAPLLCALVITGCGDDNLSDESYTPPTDYTFESRTNTDISSSVTTGESVTSEFLVRELFEFINSDDVTSLTLQQIKERVEKIYFQGTSKSSNGSDSSLANYNIYAGFAGFPTGISTGSSSVYPYLQSTFSDLATAVNLGEKFFGGTRSLPFHKIIEVDSVEQSVGNFIGLPELTENSDGNNLPAELVANWLDTRANFISDGDLSTEAITLDGIHIDLILRQFLLGAINYSLIVQNNLAPHKGLVGDNLNPVNLSDVEAQELKVEESELRLKRADISLEAAEEVLASKLEIWLDADPEADPSKLYVEYETDYAHSTVAEEYYIQKAVKDSAVTFQESMTEALEDRKSEVEDYLPFTHMSKNWDEALGYFGASRNYGAYSDQELSDQSEFDHDGDAKIDIFTEMNFAYAVLASERDLGAVSVHTNYSGTIWDAFLMGREIIQRNHGKESKEFVGYHTELKVQADIIVSTLERVVASSIIHQLNNAIRSLEIDDPVSSLDSQYFQDWSNLKGMALTLQFNDNPVISEDNLLELHRLIKVSPITEQGFVLAHKTDLINARAIIRDAYGFDHGNAEAW